MFTKGKTASAEEVKGEFSSMNSTRVSSPSAKPTPVSSQTAFRDHSQPMRDKRRCAYRDNQQRDRFERGIKTGKQQGAKGNDAKTDQGQRQAHQVPRDRYRRRSGRSVLRIISLFEANRGTPAADRGYRNTQQCCRQGDQRHNSPIADFRSRLRALRCRRVGKFLRSLLGECDPRSGSKRGLSPSQ
jgi:hypothetical protein